MAINTPDSGRTIIIKKNAYLQNVHNERYCKYAFFRQCISD